MDDAPDVAAGGFASWVEQTLDARTGDGGIDVPCGECTACCRSSYFIHIGADETRTLARIPKDLRFPAPGLAAGNVVLGFDERGWCPMLVDDRCSIYADRPRTCRRYDCRVFAAAGLEAEDDDKPLIAQRVRRWRFDMTTADDRERSAAVRAATEYLRLHPEVFPDAAEPRTGGDLAIAAISVHGEFLAAQPDPERVRAALGRAS